MARLSVAVALLFFFFAFSPSVARIQIKKPKYNAIVRQLTNPLPTSDVKPSLRLPSQTNKVKILPATQPRLELDGKVARPDQKGKPVQKPQDSNVQKAQSVKKLSDPNAQKAQPIKKLSYPNAQKVQPVEKLSDPNDKKAQSVEKFSDPNNKKAQPVKKLSNPNGQKIQPVEKLSDPNSQKAQIVNLQAESNVKKNMKPVVRLPYLALPVKHRSDSIAVKNQTELTIKPQSEKNNEESEVFELRSDLDLIVKPQPESKEEQSKPIENQPESEAQPETNDYEARPIEPETKSATVEALPLKDVSFRPRSRLPYRLCRHSHLHHIEENIPSRSSQEEIPYGNGGMTITFAENGDFDQDVFHGSFNHVPPKMFPFLNRHPHRQNDINVEEVSKHLPKIAHEKKVSYLLAEDDDREKASNRLPENSDLKNARRVLPKSIPFLHRNGPHHFRQHVVPTEKISNRLPENKENNNGKDSNRLTKNNRGGVSNLPRKWIPFLHQLQEKKVKDQEKPKNFHRRHHDGAGEKKAEKRQRSEKKESNLRKRIRKFLGHYFD